MAWKRKYPITSLEDLSPRETRKLVETVRNYEPEDESVVWPFSPGVRWVIALLIIAVCIRFLLGG